MGTGSCVATAMATVVLATGDMATGEYRAMRAKFPDIFKRGVGTMVAAFTQQLMSPLRINVTVRRLMSLLVMIVHWMTIIRRVHMFRVTVEWMELSTTLID